MTSLDFALKDHASRHKTGGADAIAPADIGAATSDQGALADTAVQPAGLAPYAQTADVATAAQGLKADTAVQPGTPAPVPSAFLSALGGKVVFDDDFQRPDQTIASGGNGVLAPTGQIYRSEGAVSAGDTAVIASKRHVWADQTTAGSDPIRILDAALTQTPAVVGGEFVFVAGTSDRQNAVIGCMTTASFNVASIQLAVYPTKWRLFKVVDSTQTDVATGTFDTPLIVDGETRHQIFLRRDPATSTVVAECDGTVLATFTDAIVNTNWGRHVGFQERLEVAGDGSIEWTHIAASSVEAAPSGLDASLSIDADTSNYLRSTLTGFAPQDLVLTFMGTPSAGWASGHLQGLISKWSSATSQKSWGLSVYNTGALQLFMTTDGSTEQHCSSSAVDASAVGVKAAYDHTAGTVTYSQTLDGDTWTQIGSAVAMSGGGGVPFAGPDYVPVTVGNRDNNSSFTYGGTITYASIGDDLDGDPIADADLTVVRGSSWYDDHGVQWAICGDWTWNLPSSAAAADLGDLGDVDLSTAPTDGQVLAYNGTASKWEAADAATGSGGVSSVNTQTGAVVLDADDIDDSATTNRFVTAADLTKLGNLSGTNTGDQTSVTGNAGTATKLATARNINGVAFDGSADITVADSTKVPTTRTVAGHALSADVTIAAADITDASTVGQNVLKAADAAAARTAIGAGTSNLALGTTSTTALAGDTTIPDATTSADDLTTGTLSIERLPAGMTVTVVDDSGTWPDRPTSRTDIFVNWRTYNGTAEPSAATSPAVNGAYDGVDTYESVSSS